MKRTSSLGTRTSALNTSKEGSALIVTLWVLIILSLLVGSFAFDMYIESGITSYYRKRLKAQFLARAGVEYAKHMLDRSFKADAKESAPAGGEDAWVSSVNLSRGMGVSIDQELGDGKFMLEILPEQGRRNVNSLTDEDWEEVLDQGGVPQDRWPELIDCFHDWTDDNDEHQLNGAESDDSFYEQRDYECKNAPLDTVDELMLIKGFDPEIVYGGTTEDGDVITGIAHLLTTWGDGKVNVNTASREVLLTIPGLEEFDVDDIIAGRMGTDQTEGTKDDGYESVDDVMGKLGITDAAVKEKLTVTERRFVRVISKGEVQNVRSGIWCILQAEESGVTPLFWREEDMP